MSLRETTGEVRRRRAPVRRTAIDVNHLRSQTLGNTDLQRKVLRLFVQQLAACIERIREADSVEARSEAAHTLVGAARGVGALSVAYIAGEIELAKGPITGRLIALERAAGEARFAITGLLTE